MQNKVLWGTAGGLLVGLLAGYIIGFEVHDAQSRRGDMGGGLGHRAIGMVEQQDLLARS